MKDLVIIGTGGVGRETALIVEAINKKKCEWNLIGFLDDDINKIGQVINGYKVLGDRSYLSNCDEEVYAICAIANYSIKKSIVESLKINEKIKFPTLIHPSVDLNESVEIGEGCIIYSNSVITTNIKIGNHVIVSPKCGIGHDTRIDDFVTLLWNVNVSGNVTLEEGVTMGSGSTIIQGLKVDKGSYIGAGTVVIRNIKENSKVVGVPGRYIGEDTFSEKNIVYNNSK